MATFSSQSHHAAHAAQQYLQNPLPENPYDPQDFAPNGDMLSPLENLGILKNLTGEKKQTKGASSSSNQQPGLTPKRAPDGQPPKRRGPKPDSKPALTRRQELNRQAQRTHRERKEMYIKALEQHAMSLREAFAKTEKERDDLAKENQMLKELLLKNGIAYDFSGNKITFQRDPSPHHMPSSSGSISGSYQNPTESTSLSPPPNHLGGGSFSDANSPQRVRNMAQLPNPNLDYDAIGMDFVLTLEKPCTDHMQYLLVRSHNPEGQVHHHPMENADDAAHEHMSGHALMVTSVPYSHIMHRPAEPYAPATAAAEIVHHAGLKKLLEISGSLPFAHEGELAPIQALSMIWSCGRLADLTPADFERIKLNLADKVRCYGFGAVLEEFEVRDTLSAVLEEKDSAPAGINQAFAAQAISAQ